MFSCPALSQCSLMSRGPGGSLPRLERTHIDLLSRLKVLYCFGPGEAWFEEGRGDEGRYDRAQDDHCHEDRICGLVDESMGVPKERGDRSEREPDRHQQGCVVRLTDRQPEDAGERPHTDDFRAELHRKE